MHSFTTKLLLALAVLLLTGSVVTSYALPEDVDIAGRLFCLLCGGFAAGCLRFLFKPLTQKITASLLVWVLLLIFLLFYYLKFWISLVAPDLIETVLDRGSRYSGEVWLSTYGIITLAFGVFCLAAAHTFKGATAVEEFPRMDARVRSRVFLLSFVLLVLSALALLWSDYMVSTYQVAIMGGEKVLLPYKLAGLTLNTRQVALPLILFLVLGWGLRIKSKLICFSSIGLLYGLAFSELLLRTSKAFLVVSSVLVVVSIVLERGKVSRKTILIAVISIILPILLYPFMRAYRSYRSVHEGASPPEIVLAVLADRQEVLEGRSLLMNSMMNILERGTGAEQLLAILDFERSRSRDYLGMGVFFDAFTGLNASAYLTEEIHGLDPRFTGTAPGLVGFWYLVYGPVGVAVGTFLFCWFLFSLSLWVVRTEGIRAKSFLFISILLYFYPYLVDGMFDLFNTSSGLRIGGFMVLMLAAERGTRRLFGSTGPRRAAGPFDEESVGIDERARTH